MCVHSITAYTRSAVASAYNVGPTCPHPLSPVLMAYNLPSYVRDTSHLTGLHLTGSHLTGSHLTGSHLTGSHLTGLHLTGSHLTGSHLTGSHLTGSHLTGSHLTGSPLIALSALEYASYADSGKRRRLARVTRIAEGRRDEERTGGREERWSSSSSSRTSRYRSGRPLHRTGSAADATEAACTILVPKQGC